MSLASVSYISSWMNGGWVVVLFLTGCFFCSEFLSVGFVLSGCCTFFGCLETAVLGLVREVAGIDIFSFAVDG